MSKSSCEAAEKRRMRVLRIERARLSEIRGRA